MKAGRKCHLEAIIYALELYEAISGAYGSPISNRLVGFVQRTPTYFNLVCGMTSCFSLSEPLLPNQRLQLPPAHDLFLRN